jgi:hypothetical protein
MKSIKDIIFYYRSCPFCGNWITLDADLPLPSTLEIADNKLILTLIEDNKDENKIYDIMFSNNKIVSEYPFAFKNVLNVIRRLYLDEPDEFIKIEARCYSCNNFRYWSKNLTYNQKTKRLNNIDIGGEKFQLHELNSSNEKISYIFSTNYNTKSSKIFVIKPRLTRKPTSVDIPFTPFKTLNFENKDRLLVKIKNMLLLT